MNLAALARPRVTFLTFNVNGIGGIARIVINVANALADTHDVEILSVLRTNRTSTFPIDERVRVETLFDAGAGGRKWRRNHPDDPRVLAAAAKASDPVLRREPRINALIETRLRQQLGSTSADVVISTRPTLHHVAAEMTHGRVALIGWDHLNFPTRYGSEKLGRLLDDTVPRLDTWVTLTEQDRDDYLDRLGERAPRIQVMRNSSGWVAPDSRPPRQGKVVVAAGRLQSRKGFDRAIQAWRPLAESHPDWQLRIYGSGPSQKGLQAQIDEAGLGDAVCLMGYHKDFRSVLASAEIFLMTSRAEGFPMVLVEAMSQGTPIVTMDCPRGPAEIVKSGQNGELVANGDISGTTAALRKLLDDAELRARMGEQAMADSREYEMDVIAARWRSLIADVAPGTTAGRVVRRAALTARALPKRVVRRGG